MLLPLWAAHSSPGQNWSWASEATAVAKSAPPLELGTFGYPGVPPGQSLGFGF